MATRRTPPAPRRKADAILAADIHLTDRVPVCRRPEEFHAAMWRKLDFIRELQSSHGEIPVLVAGDVCDRWSLPPWVLREAILRIQNWVAIPGQHDLPQHRLEGYDKSALAVLEAAGSVRTIGPHFDLLTEGKDIAVTGFPWGAEIGGITPSLSTNVALVHHLVYAEKPPFPGAEVTGSTAKALLKKMSGFDLVVTGDNHGTVMDYETTLTGEPEDHEVPIRLLVNPGSMMRTSAKQVDHEPSVFLWYAETNTVGRVVLPHSKDAVRTEHLVQEQEKNDRLGAFVARCVRDEEVGLSFEDNLRRFLAANPVRPPVEELIWKYTEEGK